MRKRLLITAALAAVAAMSVSMAAQAGQWKEDGDGWWWDRGDGTWPSSCWEWIDGDGNGVAESYCFDEAGYMYADTTTPDGYTVNSEGAWVENGVVQTQAVASGGSSDSADMTEKTGQMTITDSKGNVYTLSKPLLNVETYTQGIMVVGSNTSGTRYTPSPLYVLEPGTVVTAPDGVMLTSYSLTMIIESDDGLAEGLGSYPGEWTSFSFTEDDKYYIIELGTSADTALGFRVSDGGDIRDESGNLTSAYWQVEPERARRVPRPENEWEFVGDRWRYKHADGSYTVNNWEVLSESAYWVEKYFFDKDGWLVTRSLIKWQNGWYYVDGSGRVRTGPGVFDLGIIDAHADSEGRVDSGTVNYASAGYYDADLGEYVPAG